MRPVNDFDAIEARGRVRVSFPTIKTAPNKDITGLDVTVTVDEGETFNLGKVSIEGPTPLKPEELLNAGIAEEGFPALAVLFFQPGDVLKNRPDLQPVTGSQPHSVFDDRQPSELRELIHDRENRERPFFFSQKIIERRG